MVSMAGKHTPRCAARIRFATMTLRALAVVKLRRKRCAVESRRLEHDVLRAVIQHVAPHLLESLGALDDLEKVISCELTDFAREV